MQNLNFSFATNYHQIMKSRCEIKCARISMSREKDDKEIEIIFTLRDMLYNFP